MSEPDEIQFACIGCGTMNPVGASVCSGCGHSFAGPDGGLTPETSSESAPTLHEPRDSYKQARRTREPTILGCIGQAIGIAVTLILTLVAFVVAFFSTCVALGGKQNALGLATVAGLCAGAVVVGFAISIWMLVSGDRNSNKSDR